MTFLGRIACGFEKATGWQRNLTTFSVGALASLALPPANFWPALFISFAALFFLLEKPVADEPWRLKTFWKAFVTGWWFGFGFFAVSLYWIGASFLVEPDKFALLLPLAVTLFPAGLALFWGTACAIGVVSSRSGVSRVLALALSLALAEWLRGNILTGFPWNMIGFASFGIAETKQLSAFVGIYGLNLLVLLWAFAPVLLMAKHRNLIGFFSIALSLAGCAFIGYFQIAQSRASARQQPAKTQPMVRIVQPNIKQNQKWARKFRQQNIDKYFSLTNTTAQGPQPSIFVWPETALPLLFEETPGLQQRIANLLPQGSTLIMGATRRSKTKHPISNRYQYFNSVLVVNETGKVQHKYDKFHLVPFGEYLPGEKWIGQLGIRQIVTLPGGFSTGPGPQTIRARNVPPFSPLICYEIIFSGNVIDPKKRPSWIINVTNDGWFASTAGPHQHLAQARLRAIEEGLPVFRAANTGISAVIGPHGEILGSIDLGQSGTIDAPIPQYDKPTVFSIYGQKMFWIEFISILMIFMLLGFGKGGQFGRFYAKWVFLRQL